MNLAIRTKINIFIYHSTGNDERKLMVFSDLKLVRNPKSYAKNKKTHFLHFFSISSFSVFRFFRAKFVQIAWVENTLGRKPEQRAIEWYHKNWVVLNRLRSKIDLENSVLNFLENVQLL